ncbi:hypothetical protein [Streptomyces griseus]|uniref:hypothetical protein n=1 Tax=Streptomyces griseus TaxID=1911 RepID=UPI00378A8E16
MDEKPDLNITLTKLRQHTADFRASLERHTSGEGRGKGIAFDVGLLEERDDVAVAIVEDFDKLDTEMSKRWIINGPAPAAWTVEKITDEQLAACKADWPELALFADDTIRRMANVVGIRMVRSMAQEAVRRAPNVLPDLTSQ